MPVHVVTDSVSSLPPDMVRAYDIDVVSLYVNDGDTHQADVEIDPDPFYRRLADLTHLPTSSQPSVESFVTTFTDAASRGLEVVGVFISEKMSGTVETARMAAGLVRESLPDAVIEIVDSGSNSMQEGFAALAAAKAAQAGESVERCIQAARETSRRTRYLFTPHSLEYLRRGGRIGTASALLGQLLQVRPILTVTNGQTATFAKVRTQGRALAEMARQFGDDVREYGLRQVVVHYIADRPTAERFAEERIEPIVGEKVRVLPVSAVVGVHVGPAVAVVYETEREFVA